MARKSSSKSRKPTIASVVAASGERLGQPVKRVRPGDTLRVAGTGFGRDPNKAQVLFDETLTGPLKSNFSTRELLVTVPSVSTSAKHVLVRSPAGLSKPFPLHVVVPKPYAGSQGEPTARLFRAIDELAVLAATAARAALPALATQPVARAELNLAARSLDGARLTAQKCFDLWMSWIPLQEGQDFAALRTIAFYDDVVEKADLVARVDDVCEATFGPGGALSETSQELNDNLFEQAAAGQRGKSISESLTQLSFGDIGFWLHEGVKVVEAIENIFKVLRPSVDVGPVDASVSLGEIFSGIAKFIDIVAQIFIKLAGDQSSAELNLKIDLINLGVELLEGKADRMEEKLDQIAIVLVEIREVVRRIEAEVNANNGSLRVLADLLGRTLVGQGWIVDPRQTLTGNPVPDRDVKQELHDIEDKVDRLEAKADRADEKLDREEEKLDRQEEKLDRQEEKLDRQEEKLDRFGVSVGRPAEGAVAGQRGRQQRVTASVVALRPQDNRVYLRAAVDVSRTSLDQVSQWSDWIDFDRPVASSPLLEVSLDLQYEEGSDVVMSGLLSTRDSNGRVFHRGFEGATHDVFLDATTWSDWQDFLDQP